MTDSLSLLAGFTFAHAAWSISDLGEDELLVPLAILEKSDKRELFRFEAETQEEAISEGKAMISAREDEVDAWAFAREGQMRESGEYVDVLSVEAKASHMPESIVFVQCFQPFSKGEFLLLGDPLVSIGGKAVPELEARELVAQLWAGVQSHSKAAELWNEWLSE
jgi:hypothetical protein